MVSTWLLYIHTWYVRTRIFCPCRQYRTWYLFYPSLFQGIMCTAYLVQQYGDHEILGLGRLLRWDIVAKLKMG